MINPQVQWTAPAPLWQPYANSQMTDERAAVRRPHILRFATDRFMDEFIAMLQNEPERLHEWIVRPETWRGPSAELAPVRQLTPLVRRLQRLRLATAAPLAGSTTAVIPFDDPQEDELPLKLYQPGHMRFYLVTACLVCRIPGLPDRTLDFGSGERVSYVVRRLRPKAGAQDPPATFDLDSCDEYALVNGNRWEKARADALVPGEEQNPMFGVTYVESDGRKRRVLAAAIPVGKREAYMGAAAGRVLLDDDPPAPMDPRQALLLRTVTDPWRRLIEQYDKMQAQIATGPVDVCTTTRLCVDAEDQADLLSWYTLLDLDEFGQKYLPDVWQVITGAAGEDSLDSDADAKALYAWMKSATFAEGDVTRSLITTLADIRPWRTSLETTTVPYSTVDPPPEGVDPVPPGVYPDFKFPLHATNLRVLVTPPEGAQSLDDLVVAALPATLPAKTPPLSLAAALSMLDVREPGWFIIRCVFERPNCVPLIAPLLSEAIEPFQMASFFDPDAPARPIRIDLPLDTSPAGLRKFDRNTAFMISDVLCGQMERMGDVTFGDLVLSVLPWPFHKDLPAPDKGPCPDGMICSLSIPIITICAMILLIIIVTLLDIVFHWIPFFKICFPLPRFKGKEA